MLYMNSLFEAILSKKNIKIGDKTINITPKLSKRDFLNSLNDLGKKSEQEYFEYFDLTPISLQIYPTIKSIKEEYGISYEDLSDIGRIDLSKRVGHSSINATLKYYQNCNNKNNDSIIRKELPQFDYLEFMVWFGDNKELYKKLKPLKEDSKSTWKEIKNLKWRDVDLENNVIEYITNLDSSNKGNIPVYIFYEGTKKLKLLNRNIWLNDSDDTIYKLNVAFGLENVKII